MKKLIIAILAAGLVLAAWLIVAAISESNDQTNRARAGQQLQQDFEQERKAADHRAHIATCELHKGDRSALKLHGCNPDGTVRQVVNSDGTVSEAPDGGR